MSDGLTLRTRAPFRPLHILVYVFLVGMSAIFIYPIFYSLGVTFMENIQFRRSPPGIIPIPNPWFFDNIKQIVMIQGDATNAVGIWYLNSIVRVVWFVLLQVFSCLVCGFVFARMRFKGKGVAFVVMMMTTLLPGIVTVTPTFLMMAGFPLVGGNDILGHGGTGFFNSYPSLLILGILNINGIFLVRMSLEAMPKAMEEAAIMDGASLGTILFRIVFPMQKSIFAYIAITTFMGVWNDWYTPFVFNQSINFQTIASGMVGMTSSLMSTHGVPEWPKIMAQGLAMNIPCIVVYIVFQRYIVAGLSSSAIKG